MDNLTHRNSYPQRSVHELDTIVRCASYVAIIVIIVVAAVITVVVAAVYLVLALPGLLCLGLVLFVTNCRS